MYDSQEKQKYEYDDLDVIMPSKMMRSMKKLVTRKTEKDLTMIDEPTEDKPKTPVRKMPIPKKTEIAISEIAPEMTRDDKEEKAMEEPLPTEAVVKLPAKEIRKRKRKRRKRRPRGVVFRLPRPCKVGVCKPDICCRRITSRKLRTRYVHGFSVSIA